MLLVDVEYVQASDKQLSITGPNLLAYVCCDLCVKTLAAPEPTYPRGEMPGDKSYRTLLLWLLMP